MKSSRNHFIPRFLLSYFADGAGLLYGHDIVTGRGKRKGPGGFAFEHELYRATGGDEDAIEVGHSDTESRMSVVITNVLKNGTIEFLTREQMQALCAFVAHQAGKLPYIRQQVRDSAGPTASSNAIQREFIQTMWDYFMEGGAILSLSQARLLVTHTSFFVLGDRPVLTDRDWTVLEIPNPLPRVWMPLSPTYAIEFVDPTVVILGGRSVPDSRDEFARWPVIQATHALTDTEVEEMNIKQVSAATQYVFSREKLGPFWASARRKARFHLLSAE